MVEYAGTGSCSDTKASKVKTVALKKGGGWTFIGGWKRTFEHCLRMQCSFEFYVFFIFLRLSSPQKPCNGDPSGVCMDRRRQALPAAATAAGLRDAAPQSAPSLTLSVLLLRLQVQNLLRRQALELLPLQDPSCCRSRPRR